MEELYKLDLSKNTIKNMIELNSEIKLMSNKNIKEKKVILEEIGLNQNQIRNVISSNPLCLSRTNNEIIDLIKYLYNNEFDGLDILFDSNPYILNLEPFEIDNYINKRKKQDLLEFIIDDLDSNPVIFNEM